MAKKIDANLTVAKSDDEAINYFIIALKFFLQKHTWKTILILAIIGLSLIMTFQKQIMRAIGFDQSDRHPQRIELKK